MLVRTRARSFLVSGLLVTGLFSAFACSGSDPDGENPPATGGNGMGGSQVGEDTSQALSALVEEIEKLRSELETAGAEERKDLLDRIKELNEQLQDLKNESAPTCGEGGECEGLKAAEEGLRPVFQAICDLTFNCCSADQSRLALGPSVETAEQCTDVLIDRAARGLDPTEFGDEYSTNFRLDLPDIDVVTSSLESGRVEIDEAAVEFCALLISQVECSAFNNYGYGYGYGFPDVDSCSPLAACNPENWFLGQVGEGEPCEVETAIDACMEGTFCSGDGSQGTCVRGGAVGDKCFSSGDCGGGSYCDIDAGQCAARCQDGAPCDDDEECGLGLYCDDESEGNPICAVDERLDIGGVCEDSNDCKSDYCRSYENESRCSQYCNSDASCGSGNYCRNSYCEPLAETGDYCSGEGSCLEPGDLCIGTSGPRCFAPVEAGDACPATVAGTVQASRLCPEGTYCSVDSDTCVAQMGLGTACENDVQCGSSAYCGSAGEEGSVCIAQVGRGGDCSEDECGSGLFCETFYDGSENHSVCLPEEEGSRKVGELCGRYPYSVNAQLCETGRCRWFNGETYYAICESGLEQGEACDAQAMFETSSSYATGADPCDGETYCKVTNPDDDDYEGVCAPRIVPGGVCNPDYPSLVQCEDGQSCSRDYDLNVYRCQGSISYEETQMCPIKGFSYNDD